MEKEVQRSWFDWKDPSLTFSWSRPDPDIVQEIEDNQGRVAPRFAFCPAVSQKRLSVLVEGLRQAGYRPIRCRPFAPKNPQKLTQFAVVWTRDDQAWKWAGSLSVQQIRQVNLEWQKQGYVPVDVAGYLHPQGNSSEARFATVWVRANVPAKMFVQLPLKTFVQQSQLIQRHGFALVTVQSFLNPEGKIRCCGVIQAQPSGVTDFEVSLHATTLQYRQQASDLTRLPLDVDVLSLPQTASWFSGTILLTGAKARVAATRMLHDRITTHRVASAMALWSANPIWFPVTWVRSEQEAKRLDLLRKDTLQSAMRSLEDALAAGYHDVKDLENSPWLRELHSEPRFPDLIKAARQDLRYSTVLRTSPLWEVKQIHALELADHRRQSRELESLGYRITAMSVAETSESGKRLVTSLWHRPLPDDDQRDRLAQRKANAACALLKLGRDHKAWEILKHDQYPDARSHFIHTWATLRVPASVLVKQLKTEQDVGILRALVLALGPLHRQMPESLRQHLIPLMIQWYREHPDPGLHSAVGWWLRFTREGSMAISRIDRELQGRFEEKRRWYVDRQGQTFAILDASEEFRMGSPLYEESRIELNEMPHRRHIGRTFAIATTEVTVDRFKQFLQAHPEVQHSHHPKFTPVGSCPILSVTWYEAIAYCRWLSEQEGIPEDQMCYPPVSMIMKSANGLIPLKLPEDYLSRTGYRLPTEAEWEYAARSGTRSSRFFGSSEQFLSHYAWDVTTSNARTWPVSLKRPNDFGLFDVYGNVREWGQEMPREYGVGRYGYPVEDSEDRQPITDLRSRPLRGGSFSDYPAYLRSAYRSFSRPTRRRPDIGFRVVRTMNR